MKTAGIKKLLFVSTLLVVLSGCTTGYQRLGPMTMTGGFKEVDLGKNVYRVYFGANGYTSRETCQTFWLYRCAELALEKGFDGFEIISDVRLSKAVSVEEAFGMPERLFEPAQYIPIIIPMDDSNKPFMEADILLLKGPIEPSPPRVFDASKLKEALEPHVREPIDKRKNVKPHIHDYLLPEGKLDEDQKV